MISYLVTMIMINSNIRIAEINHPPCRKNATGIIILDRVVSHYNTFCNKSLLLHQVFL
jgi:hypothetical protein